MPFGCVKTLWSKCGNEAGAVIPACEVRIDGDYNSVDLFVANGPTVMLILEEDGSFTVSVFAKASTVRIEKAVDDEREFLECKPVEE